MGGALLELVAKGSQDIFLTGNPDTTYFKSVYKRHTNFSTESIIQSVDGLVDFGKRIEVSISRSGDLLSSIILEIDLPKLEGKRGKNIQWVDSIGHHLIRSIEFQIGEQTIDKHYGEWMEIWSELTINESKKTAFNTMIGKGITISDERTLFVPLSFWFCRDYGLALPLIALQYHEVKLIIELNTFDSSWKKEFTTYYLDKNSNEVTINTSKTNNVSTRFSDVGDLSDGLDNYFDMTLLWDDGSIDKVVSRQSDNSLTIINNDSSNKTGYAYLIEEEPKETLSLRDLRVYCDYIYLDIGERKYFAQTKHMYLIEQLQTNGINAYTLGKESNKIDLEFNHPCKELIWVNNLDFNKNLNLPFNFSDRVDTLYGSDNPITDVELLINGHERFNKRKSDYFRLVLPFQKHTRAPTDFIYVYSFCLNPEEHQPSGTCNFSRLDNAELILNYKNGINDLTTKVYALNYNILNIVNGMGGLGYSN
tara:strand:+ start:1916 stop:3349 length:1434 start_codon:yes stop_codon:yes gene_type:complete